MSGWGGFIGNGMDFFTQGTGGGINDLTGVTGQNNFSAAQSERQQVWTRENMEQARMWADTDYQRSVELANTAHQREVADLKAAGLNPILSGTGGSGAASPQHAAPAALSGGGSGGGGTSGGGGMLASLISAGTNYFNSAKDRQLTDEQIKKTHFDTLGSVQDAATKSANYDLIEGTREDKIAAQNARYQADKAEAERDKAFAEKDKESPNRSYWLRQMGGGASSAGSLLRLLELFK